MITNERSPKITFGIIVLNGEPFIRYNLRALYPFAHQIIVVEGAALAAAGIATQGGHSIDTTLDTLHHFKTNEDPENKLLIVTAEDEGHIDGFWPGEKHEQSQAYAKRATGDYLWQIDADEFYKREDMQTVLELLQQNPDISAVSFKQITFWGGFDYITDGWYLRRVAVNIHRVFKWGIGYRYITHRPPTIIDPTGTELRSQKWISGHTLARQGIIMYHYSLLLPRQVTQKCDYYASVDWGQFEKSRQWAQDVFQNLRHPYRVHNVYDSPSWLERFTGSHPEQIDAMRRDIVTGEIDVELRQTDDIEAQLRSLPYVIGRYYLKLLGYLTNYEAGFFNRHLQRWYRLFRFPVRTIRRKVFSQNS